MKKVLFAVFLIAAALVTMFSCGYRFSSGGLLPGNTATVAVRTFENKSDYSGAETRFANALVQEIMIRSDTRVVDLQDADAVISGTIRSITFSTLSRTSSDQVLERQVTALIDVKMVDSEGLTVWELRNFRGVEDGFVSSDNTSDESGKKDVIEQAFAKMAHKIVAAMCDDF